MLMEQVEHDATPEFLEELKTNICAGQNQNFHPNIVNLSEIFQDASLNPLKFPFEYLLNGNLPSDKEESQVESTQVAAETTSLKNRESVIKSDKSNVEIKE